MRHLIVLALLLLAPLSLPGCIAGEACLADDGCADPAVSVDGCGGSDDDALELDELLEEASARVGEEVVVEGPLRRELGATCTAVGCSAADACCSDCAAALLLAPSDPADPFSARTLVLDGDLSGVALGCSGDESLQCCPVPTDGRTVRARGTLAEWGTGLEGPLYSLRVRGLCAP